MAAKCVCVDDYEIEAKKIFTDSQWRYLTTPAENGKTMKRNLDIFKKTLLSPRYLRDVTTMDYSCKILGKASSCPIGISPTALHKLYNKEGEKSTARAAKSEDVIYTVSSFSTSTLEDIQNACGPSRRWFQTYIYESKETMKSLISNAIKNGIEALVLTIDAPVPGLKTEFARKPINIKKEKLSVPLVPNKKDIYDIFVIDCIRSDVTWETIKWLKSITEIPLILKGFVRYSDAISAIENGVDAIWISNHGGRQFDHVPSTLQVLKRIGPLGKKYNVDVYIDGGVRCGADVFKCLAMGATAVFLGKPILMALGVEGEDGVKNVFRILKGELKNVMAICGTRNIGEINDEYLWDCDNSKL